MHRIVVYSLLLACLSNAACTKGGKKIKIDSNTTQGLTASTCITLDDIQPIIIQNCVQCHAPFKDGGRDQVPILTDLLSLKQYKPLAATIVVAVSENKTMPPTGQLPEEKQNIFMRWKASDFAKTKEDCK